MIATIAFLMLGQDSLFGKFHSRQEFSDAIGKIDGRAVDEGQWTKTKIRALLGQPDDIWISTDPKKYINMPDGEVWCYGTNGHHTLPTLGSVTFRGDKVLFANYSPKPPSPSLISEEELRRSMRQIHRFSSREGADDEPSDLFEDPLHLIQSANAIIPLGTVKALAVLRESDRIVPGWSEGGDFLFWLVRTAFRGKKPGYVFPVPMIGAMSPVHPKVLSKWPTYPLVNIANFPFLIYYGATLAGHPEPFDMYAETNAKNWEVLDKKLIPPNDPFPLYKEVLQTKVMPFGDREKGVIRSTILRSVRNAIKPSRDDWDESRFESVHKEFLRLKAHWDYRLEIYVRGDGSFDKDQSNEYRQTTFSFPNLRDLTVSVTFSRDGESSIDLATNVGEVVGKMIPPAVLEVVDKDTAKVLAVHLINSSESSSEESRSKMLSRKPYKSISGGMGMGTGFSLPVGHHILFKLYFGGKIYQSKDYVP